MQFKPHFYLLLSNATQTFLVIFYSVFIMIKARISNWWIDKLLASPKLHNTTLRYCKRFACSQEPIIFSIFSNTSNPAQAMMTLGWGTAKALPFIYYFDSWEIIAWRSFKHLGWTRMIRALCFPCYLTLPQTNRWRLLFTEVSSK